MELVMSDMNKTWVLDLDGTIVKHNGYKDEGYDSLLPGARDLLGQIADDDMVIFVTSRKYSECGKMTEDFLADNNIRYDHIIYEAPYGERILINDNKPSGLKMAYAIASSRDEVPDVNVAIDKHI